jgi:cardiolipin synthase
VPVLLDRLLERPRDEHHKAHKHARAFKVLAVLSLIALILQSSMLLVALFEDPLPYAITDPGPETIGSAAFTRTLSAITFGGLYGHNQVDVLTNGDAFYAAELAAIGAARRFVHIECYIFQQGRLTDQFIQALEERARAGVEVRMVIDAVGSTAFPDSRFQRLREAGGRVSWYHPIRWFTWPRANNRTHREVLIVDGTVGFAGGAGFADQWQYGTRRDPRWRDTLVRVEGEAATGLNVTFAENWLESSGEMLVNPAFFPFRAGPGETNALVVTSSPTTGRSTEARMLFQTLIAKAAGSIHLTTPYFLPDKSLRQELVKAVRERKVEVTVIVPGTKNDHLLTRRSSRSLCGDLLRAGARIFEYQPAMVHAKTMIVDGRWAVVGSTNLDSRSFGLNDEVNVAMPDPTVARRLEQDFQNDLRQSRQVSYEQWKRRPIWEKAAEWFGWLLLNQE